MSTIPTEHHSVFIDRALRIGSFVRARAALVRIIELIALWRRRAAARRELQALCELDDYILRDIGLTRSELRQEATRPFWRASCRSATKPRDDA
jgi:uncharacterized protein YjiS (DUF1127 family)